MSALRLSLGVSLLIAASLATHAVADDSFGSQALFKALREANVAQALRLIDQKVTLNTHDDTGATPLMWAVQIGNEDLTEHLLKAGANPNLRDHDGLGPLQIAVELQASDIALQLVAHGADAKAARDSGETVLMTAARTGQIEVMKQLIARGADVNAHEEQFNQTALMWAAGYPQAVKLLIDQGANIRARTKAWKVTDTIYTRLTDTGTPWAHDGQYVSQKGGQNALFFAVQEDDIESVKALLDAGIDVNDTAADGSTALLLSVYKWNAGGKRYGETCDLQPQPMTFAPNPKMAHLLLDRGANVSVADFTGYTPLHGVTIGLVPRALLDECRVPGVQVEDANDLLETSLDRQEGLALVQRMLGLKADPNAVTRYPTAGPVGFVRINPAAPGSTPVHIAANSGNAELMQLLLEHGGDANVINGDGHSPLSIATKADDLPLVELLVAHGGDVQRIYDPTDRIVDVYGNGTQIGSPRGKQSLMHIAATAGSAAVVPFLAARGAPLNLKNTEGETPLALAENQERVRYDRKKIVALFARMNGRRNIVDPESIVHESATSEAIRRVMRVRAAASDVDGRRP